MSPYQLLTGPVPFAFQPSVSPLSLSLLFSLWQWGWAIKCHDCVGHDCMGSTCNGEYCLLSHYAPRWGTMVWGEPAVVKGCLSGKMLRGDVRSHCEVAANGRNSEEPFSCFCRGRDFCNGEQAVQRLEKETVRLYTCLCEGHHCRDKTCVGEQCTYVVNHRSKAKEKGCVNASVPLVERRSSGSCMIPPITGAMYHTVARDAEDMLSTESCVCEGDYCNSRKPKINKEREKSQCKALVQVKVMGSWMVSRNTTCRGEFCFRAEILSELGHMSNYRTMGCASFTDDAQLAEELEPLNCAKFSSEKVKVEACFMTKDKEAVQRARDSRQGRPRPRGGRTRESEEDALEWEGEGNDQWEEEEEGEKEEGEKEEEEKEAEEGEKEEEQGEEEEKEEKGTERPSYIFERPTLAPQLEESTNTTLISVFLLLILLILLSGVVWKLQLHKRLFRASYDSVAGG